jgi:hypothetical protein
VKKREKLCVRAEALHDDMMKLKQQQLLGKDGLNKDASGLTLSEIVELLMTTKSPGLDIPISDATKSGKEIFDQVFCVVKFSFIFKINIKKKNSPLPSICFLVLFLKESIKIASLYCFCFYPFFFL